MSGKQKGVLVVGMEMPNKCGLCPLLNIDGRKKYICFMKQWATLREEEVFIKRPSWCPLQEVK